METSEINILELIHNNDILSQRDISDHIGLSLGMVNLLLKKFVKIGIVKTEKLNGNKIRYMLTPKGFTYLANKTIQYVTVSYQAVQKIRGQLRELVLRIYNKEDTVLILAQEDEVYAILIDVLREEGYEWIRLSEPSEQERYLTWGREIRDEFGIDVFGR